MTTTDFGSRSLRDLDRGDLLRGIVRAVGDQTLSIGDAVRVLRVGLLGMDRLGFARVVGVSDRALAQLETGRGNPTMATLEKIFGRFGLTLGLVGVPGTVMAAATQPLSPGDYDALVFRLNGVLERNRRG